MKETVLKTATNEPLRGLNPRTNRSPVPMYTVEGRFFIGFGRQIMTALAELESPVRLEQAEK